MGHKNYSNFSKHFKKTENNEVEKVEVIEGQISVDEVLNNEVESVEVEEPVVETIAEPKVGFVNDCERLNMRKEASKSSEVVTILHKYAELQIDEANSTEEFYKVTTLAGIEGYCMKKFIKVK